MKRTNNKLLCENYNYRYCDEKYCASCDNSAYLDTSDYRYFANGFGCTKGGKTKWFDGAKAKRREGEQGKFRDVG